MYVISYCDDDDNSTMKPHWIESVKVLDPPPVHPRTRLDMEGSPYKNNAVQVSLERAREMKKQLLKWGWPDVRIVEVTYFIGQNICIK